MTLETPYYMIDERKLRRNLKKIKFVRESCGAKSVLALKCFSTWSVFDLMKQYMDGTTSSSLYEARLGREKFGGEVHAYSVAFSAQDIREVAQYADKIIFNSVSQLKRFHRKAGKARIGLRVNPGVSFSHFDLADPARKYSRLGTKDMRELLKISPLLDGVMFHFNCENDNIKKLSGHIDTISSTYGEVLSKVNWVSLGGGIYFTKEGFPLEEFCKILQGLRDRFGVQIYLEPGESAITQSAELVTKVLDIVTNEIQIAIVDSSTEAHMLDLLTYRIPAKINTSGRFTYMIAGRSCLAGDVFGTFRFPSRLKIGSTIRISDAAGYTMVKKNWFNGLQMPSIVVKRLDGSCELVRQFGYKDFINSLS